MAAARGSPRSRNGLAERGRDEGAPSEEGSGVDPVPTPPCPPPAVGAAAAGGGGGGGGEAAVASSSRASAAAAGGDGGSCDRQGGEDGSWAVGRGSGSCCSFLPRIGCLPTRRRWAPGLGGQLGAAVTERVLGSAAVVLVVEVVGEGGEEGAGAEGRRGPGEPDAKPERRVRELGSGARVGLGY